MFLPVSAAFDSLSVLLGAALALAVVFLLHKNPAARLFAWWLLLWPLSFREHLTESSFLTTEPVQQTVAVAAIVLAGASLLRFSAVFPSPPAANDVSWDVARRFAASPTAVWVTATVVAGWHAILQLSPWFSNDSSSAPAMLFLVLVVAWIFGTLIVSISTLRLTSHLADQAARRRIYWILQGFLVLGLSWLVGLPLTAIELFGTDLQPRGCWFNASLGERQP